MMLADMGAEVVTLDRVGAKKNLKSVAGRGRKVVEVDLKSKDAIAQVLDLLSHADALIEGFRPGVMERLGLGPDVVQARNPRLVYGRMTGWGQEGPLAQAAGHDINYISVTGALAAIGGKDKPVPPLNLVGDFGGGGLLLAFGLLAALLHAQKTGQGQVVDAAMTDGAALLMAMIYSLKGNGAWSNRRGDNLFDGGLPLYGTYRCRDGKWLAVGPLEPQFAARFLQELGLEGQDPRAPALRAALTDSLAQRDRDDWCAHFDGLDVCVAPVLDLDEAPAHPHNRARETFIARDGVVQPAPAPRFSRTPATLGAPPPRPGQDTGAALADWGFAPDEIADLLAAGVIA